MKFDGHRQKRTGRSKRVYICSLHEDRIQMSETFTLTMYVRIINPEGNSRPINSINQHDSVHCAIRLK